jgi:ATP-dependent Clp protease ATP-binding subunit ClpA
MFERFTVDARNAVAQAQEQARRLGHGYIGCEHLLLAAAATGESASTVLREHGVTPEAVETQIVRLVGLGHAADLFSALDSTALASIGIDLDAVRARLEAAFGPDALTLAAPRACRRGRSARRKYPLARLRRPRRPRRPHRPWPDLHAAQANRASGHIPFTPRAKKCLEHSVREAKARQDNYVGVEHLTLALVAMKDGAVPPILSALGASPANLRAAILNRYRQAS